MGPNARKWDFTRNTLSAVVNTCLIRLAVRTPRCGRGNPGSNPGLDSFFGTLEYKCIIRSHHKAAQQTEYSSVGRAFECRNSRYRMVPGSIPGVRIMYFIRSRITRRTNDLELYDSFRWQHWSSGYDVRLTRGRSPVQSWDAVLFVRMVLTGLRCG